MLCLYKRAKRELVSQCDYCRHSPASCSTARFTPKCDPTYAHTLAPTRFEYLHTLSFVHYEYPILNEARGCAHGELKGRSLLHCSLLPLSDAATEHRPFPAAFNRVLKALYEETALYSVLKASLASSVPSAAMLGKHLETVSAPRSSATNPR
jgi:hypothetical protein